MQGLRVCGFESRMTGELKSMLERQGAVATVAPSMREVPLADNPAAFAFADELFAGRVDVVILLTGVGTRALAEVIETRHSRAEFLDALQKAQIVVRGPKPAVVLREWKCRIDVQVPEPNTWRDLLAALDEKLPVGGKTVAVQEYGQPNEELYVGLKDRLAMVLPVPVYKWALPEDVQPLEAAIRETVAGGFDCLVFTSAQQVRNVLTVAERLGLRDEWHAAANRCVIASIGPTATETLVSLELTPDLEPEHPKLGHLIQEMSRSAAATLQKKRTPQP